MILRTLLRTTTLFAAMGLAQQALAVDLGEYGKITGDFRLRHEFVDQEGFDNNANATTSRLRLGYLTPTYEGLTGFVEGEVIQAIGAERFNDSQNGNTTYPSVSDPDDFALNQLYLNYTIPGSKNAVTVGRQSIVFDNQRFIGWSRFRQNDTVHDAARFTLAPTDKLVLDYVYSTGTHRSLGSRVKLGSYDGNINLAHAEYKYSDDLKFSGYGYWLSFDDYIDTLSSRTIGARADWRPKEGWDSLGGIAPIATVDFAQQQDLANNPDDYSEYYHWLELGGSKNGYSLTAVYERLGGDGNASVKTPIGTVHSFTGWVDRLDNTPNDGLKDYFLWFKGPIELPYKVQKLGFEIQLHHFESDVDSRTYGQEIDAGLTYTPVENHSITAKVGHYMADELLTDTTKVWLFYDWKF
jgi:hypothetical protein